MTKLLTIKLLVLFAVSFSLVSLSGTLANNNVFPHLNLAHANGAPNNNWVPAGPAMDTEKANIFTDTNAEFNALITPGGGKAGSIDTTDEALSTALISCLQNGLNCPAGVDPTKYSVSSQISEHGYYELQFDLSNNFWGVPFNFGSDTGCSAGSVSYTLTLSDPKTSSTTGLTTACPGVSIRQGIAHLIDNTILASLATNCGPLCAPINNPVPPSTACAGGLKDPAADLWDTLFAAGVNMPSGGGAGKVADSCTGNSLSDTGATAYHIAPATPCGVSGGCGTNTPLKAWESGLGTPDFCAAADHFIAAGLATGKDPNTCALTGIAAGVSAHTINVFTRTSYPRHDLGNSLFDAICALFTGVFQNTNSAQCNSAVATPTSITSGPFVTQTTGPITAFPGFSTSKSSTKINNDWFIYTAAFISVFPF